MSTKTLISTLAAVPVLLSAIFAATHDFTPDYVFRGSTLAGWHALGQANWRAENGEITATPQSPDGGWLVLDKGYQDLDFYTEFRCAGELQYWCSVPRRENCRRRLEGRLRRAWRTGLRDDAERRGKGSEPDAPVESNCAVRADGGRSVGERTSPRAGLCRACNHACRATGRSGESAGARGARRGRGKRAWRRRRRPWRPRRRRAGDPRGRMEHPRCHRRRRHGLACDQRAPRREHRHQRPHDGLRARRSSCRRDG